MTAGSFVIVGAGHAGVQAVASPREEGWEGAITLLSDEAELPYQRPPLSKAFLKGQVDPAGLPLRAEKFFADNRIDLRRGEKALRIDRGSKRVELSSDGGAPYDHLILATGARQRVLRIPGVDLRGVFSLRAILDAQAIRESLGRGRRIIVIGAGFIGLEIAATALALGGDVTIVEIADRPLGRAVSPAMSSFFLEAHQAFDPMQTTGQAFGQEVVPDATRPISPVAGDEAGSDPPGIVFVAAQPGARRAHEPGVEATARNTERPANPRYRPNPSMLGDEPELHIESLAK